MGTRIFALFDLKRFLELERHYITRGRSGVTVQDDGSYRISLYHLGNLYGGKWKVARLVKKLNLTVISNMRHGTQEYMMVG